MADLKPTSNSYYRLPFYAKTRFLLSVLLLITIYSYGWRVAEIELGELVQDAHLVKPLIQDLLRPDILTFETEAESASALFHLLDNKASIDNFKRGNSGPVIDISKTTGRIGDTLGVLGKGFRPNENGRIVWINSIEQEYPLGIFETNENGNFLKKITVPQIALGDTQRVHAVLEWRTGEWKFSEALKLTTEKIIETIFLALMATTFAVCIAAPLSFLGARNIMTANLKNKAIYYVIRTLFNVLRSIEPLIMAILFAVWVGIGPFAGVLALTVHSIAALGKLFSERRVIKT